MIENFIGREKELKALESKYKKDEFTLSVIYGRRRIGKSYLIRKFIEEKKSIFFQASESNISNLEELSRLIGTTLFNTEGLSFRSYDDALKTIFSYKGEEKLVFVIDEIDYIVKNEDKSLLSIIQRYVDQVDNTANIMMIITSSSLSFIESEVLNEKKPLYLRTSLQIELRAFSLKESAQYLPHHWSLDEKINAHVITGGVAYYLKALRGHENLKKALEAELFDSFGVLFNEPKLFFIASVRSFSTYDKILSLLSSGVNTVTELADKSYQEKSNVSAALSKLATWRICKNKENIIKKNKRKWTIEDNFFSFYYHFVPPFRLRIENGITIDIESLEEIITIFISHAIEKDFLNYALFNGEDDAEEAGYAEFPNPKTKTNEEIDLAIKHTDSSYSFGECKWKKSKVGLDVLENLKRRAILATGKEARSLWLLSKSGYTEEVIKEAEKDKRIRLITAEDLVN